MNTHATYLMNFLPTLQVLRPNARVVMKKSLAEHGVGLVDDAVVQRSQTLRVLVIWTSPEFQQRLDRFQTVLFHRAMHRRQTLLRSIVQERSAIHKGNYHFG